MNFGIDHIAFNEAKKTLDTQIVSAIKGMMCKDASSCTISMKLQIVRPEILDVMAHPDDYIVCGEQLQINHNVNVKVSFEYGKKGFNQNRVAIKREFGGDFDIQCDYQESMFESEEELNE